MEEIEESGLPRFVCESCKKWDSHAGCWDPGSGGIDCASGYAFSFYIAIGVVATQHLRPSIF